MTGDECRAAAKRIRKQAANPSTPAEMHYYLLDLAQMYETMPKATEKDRCKPLAWRPLSSARPVVRIMDPPELPFSCKMHLGKGNQYRKPRSISRARRRPFEGSWPNRETEREDHPSGVVSKKNGGDLDATKSNHRSVPIGQRSRNPRL